MAAGNRPGRSAPTVSDKRRSSIVRPIRDDDSIARTLYEADFYRWTKQQADLLRSRRLEDIDIDNLVEEIETLGRSERSALRSAYRLVTLHLLKLLYQPEKATNSWRVTIVRERDNIGQILADNPGLKSHRARLFSDAYASARKEAAAETGLDLSTFPMSPAFTADDVEDETFLGQSQYASAEARRKIERE